MERTRTPTRGGLLVVAAIAAATLGTAHAGNAPGDMVEMEVLGVIPLEADVASLLVLRQKGAGTVLPIFVERTEGTAIERRLKHPTSSRPPGSDLLARTIGVLGAKVSRVAIDGAKATLFSARVTLQQGDRRIEVDARPSDSVALAIASHAPIYATRHVVEEAGLTEEDLSRAGPLGGKRHERRRARAERPERGEAQSF